jgi:hypothetical protein
MYGGDRRREGKGRAFVRLIMDSLRVDRLDPDETFVKIVGRGMARSGFGLIMIA